MAAYDPHDDPYDGDEDEYYQDHEDWQEGQCDNCTGGDEDGVTADSPLGPIYCACRIGQGAPAHECTCGPEEDEDGGQAGDPAECPRCGEEFARSFSVGVCGACVTAG